jgi:hypothetical protein
MLLVNRWTRTQAELGIQSTCLRGSLWSPLNNSQATRYHLDVDGLTLPPQSQEIRLTDDARGYRPVLFDGALATIERFG